MSDKEKRIYFDNLAITWDNVREIGSIQNGIEARLNEFRISRNECILDLGCGTGILTEVLLGFLSEAGCVYAADFSESMIEIARSKIQDCRVKWLCADASNLPVKKSTFDRVICFSTWPHFSDPSLVALEITRVLKVGGLLHIFHLVSKEEVNRIHTESGKAVRHDMLPPAQYLGNKLSMHGFSILETIDGDDLYLVTARKIF